MDLAVQYGADAALIAVLVFETVWHARKGFVRTILALFAAIIAFGVALKVAEPLASWSYDAILNPIVCEKLDEHAEEFADAQTAKEVAVEVADSIPHFLGTLLQKIDVDPNEVSSQIGSSDSEEPITSEQLSNDLVKPVAMIALKTVCVLICFAVFMGVFHAIIAVIDHVTKLPVLRTANRWLGGALGFLKGLVIVYLLAMLLGLIGQITEKPQVKQVVEHSRIVTTCQQIDFNHLLDQNKTE